MWERRRGVYQLRATSDRPFNAALRDLAVTSILLVSQLNNAHQIGE